MALDKICVQQRMKSSANSGGLGSSWNICKNLDGYWKTPQESDLPPVHCLLQNGTALHDNCGLGNCILELPRCSLSANYS